MSDPNTPQDPPPFDPAAPAAPSWDAPPAPAAAPAWTPPPAGASPVPVGGAKANNVPDFLSPTWMMDGSPAPAGWVPKQKMLMGIIAILIGGLGIHSFMMGNTKKGVIQICSNLLCVGGLWGLIEGIMILMGNITTDAYGVPLTE